MKHPRVSQMAPENILLKNFKTATDRENVCRKNSRGAFESQFPTWEHGQTEKVADNQIPLPSRHLASGQKKQHLTTIGKTMDPDSQNTPLREFST